MREKMGVAVGQRRLLPDAFPRVKKRKAVDDVAAVSGEADDASKKQRFSSESRRRQKEIEELIATSDQVKTAELAENIAKAETVNAQWKQLVCEKSSQTKKMEIPQQKVYRRSAAIQVKPNMKNKETQTVIVPEGKTFREMETQCSLIQPQSPEKETFQDGDDELSDIGGRSPCESEEYVPRGDARADSPGYSAKYGSNSLMELRRSKILDVVLVQKNEVSSSNAMELEGLKRVIRWMLDIGVKSGLAIDCFVTDRHLQVAKWVRENLVPLGIQHYYDVWHIAKSIKKQLKALANRRGCEAILKWQHSIINHVYWAASSTPEADQELILEKFLSIGNHVQNVHTGHQGERFTECAHPPISDEEERTKSWLEPVCLHGSHHLDFVAVSCPPFGLARTGKVL
ncbi:hypothetical protein HOLleu_12400 [Holothuria leucospilota]|uniref:Transposase n=1 Tax=Holothuria leucospilota TaxID=206669 RepID=A0A9Q1HDR7_HOLLE|nr:hypothetical protein HOLleu_12400 [Holothuria leucospilota]